VKVKPVHVELWIYFGLGFLPPLVDIFTATAKYDYFPSWARVTTAILAGTLGGLVSIKAFMSGGWQRHVDETNGKDDALAAKLRAQAAYVETLSDTPPEVISDFAKPSQPPVNPAEGAK
jgi:hypothetical protein